MKKEIIKGTPERCSKEVIKEIVKEKLKEQAKEIFSVLDCWFSPEQQEAKEYKKLKVQFLGEVRKK